MTSLSQQSPQVDRRPHAPEWWLVASKQIDNLPTHTILRFCFREHPAVEVLTPRAIVNDEYVAHLAGLLLDRPPPPGGPGA